MKVDNKTIKVDQELTRSWTGKCFLDWLQG